MLRPRPLLFPTQMTSTGIAKSPFLFFFNYYSIADSTAYRYTVVITRNVRVEFIYMCVGRVIGSRGKKGVSERTGWFSESEGAKDR